MFLCLLKQEYGLSQQLLILNSDGTQSSYTMIFNDEFNAPEFDSVKWQNAYPWGRHLIGKKPEEESLEYYSDGRNITVDDGILSLIAKKERICGRCVSWVDSISLTENGLPNYRCFEYSSGMIYSKQEFGYGFYEARFKQSKNSKGMWPAFWLFGETGEIDIFENKGERQAETHWDLHCRNGCRKSFGGWSKMKTDFTDNYNTIAMDWSADKEKWFCNGRNYVTAQQYFSGNMHIIANNAVARSRKEKGFWIGPDASSNLPASFDIDYIRYYKKNYEGRKNNGRLNKDEVVKLLLESSSSLYTNHSLRSRNHQLLTLLIDVNSHKITVNCSSNCSKANIAVYDASGKLLKTKSAGKNDYFTIEGLPDENLIIIARCGKKLMAEKVYH